MNFITETVALDCDRFVLLDKTLNLVVLWLIGLNTLDRGIGFIRNNLELQVFTYFDSNINNYCIRGRVVIRGGGNR